MIALESSLDSGDGPAVTVLDTPNRLNFLAAPVPPAVARVVRVEVQEARRSYFDTLPPPNPGDWDALGYASGLWLER